MVYCGSPFNCLRSRFDFWKSIIPRSSFTYPDYLPHCWCLGDRKILQEALSQCRGLGVGERPHEVGMRSPGVVWGDFVYARPRGRRIVTFRRVHTNSLMLSGCCLISMVWSPCTAARATWWMMEYGIVWWLAAKTAGISLRYNPLCMAEGAQGLQHWVYSSGEARVSLDQGDVHVLLIDAKPKSMELTPKTWGPNAPSLWPSSR